MSLLSQLNEAQREAVEHESGPLLVLAGAGSGKTRALTYRAAHLIAERGVQPDQILLTTFTNKAAGEMQERLHRLIGQRLPFAGTFHSLCARLLRRHAHELGISPDFVIYDTDDQLALLKSAMRTLDVNDKQYKPRSVMGAIEQAKHELIDPDDYASYAQGPFQKEVSRIYQLYQNRLRTYGAVDFNDLLVLTVRLLQLSDRTRNHYQEQFLHVLVDEYQDTNKAQYLLTKLLAEKHRNVCVVGDASQAIYSWRGADYRNLSLLKEDFPDLTTVRLEQNYRSTQTILAAADAVISHNTMHPVLSLWTDKADDRPLVLHEAYDERDEAQFVVQTINSLKLEGVGLDDMAVLYRTNAQSRSIEEAFIRAGVPYVLVGGVKFYQRKEVKDVLAYVRLAVNPADKVSEERLVKLGKRRFAAYQSWLERADLTLEPLALMDEILEQTGYLSKYKRDDPEDLTRIENVSELRSVAQGFANVHEFLENVALVEQETVRSAADSEAAVTLMTLHASKGLEYRAVFMIGMEEGLFPHSRSVLSKPDLEEERRLAYVGITRASEYLYLTFTQSRLYFGSRSSNMPSRFLSEIPDTYFERSSKRLGMTSQKSATRAINEEALEQFLNDEIDIDDFLAS